MSVRIKAEWHCAYFDCNEKAEVTVVLRGNVQVGGHCVPEMRMPDLPTGWGWGGTCPKCLAKDRR